MGNETVYFVQISDTHFGPTAGFASHGSTALPAAQRLVDRINQLPFKPDFVVHTGDITNDPQPEAYALARETFLGLRLPIYFIRGNHDEAEDINLYMAMGPKADLSVEKGRLSYSFEVKGLRFLVFDTQGPPQSQPQGYLSAEQMRVLRREATADGPPLVIFLHHPLMPMDSPWMDANMLVMNGEEVHAALLPARQRIRGVFHGHTHQSTQTLRDDILYVAAASSYSQFASWPNDEEVMHLDDEQPGFNFVRLMPEQTMIRQHRFPAP
ncbi:MAG: metallophosphoesterase family protein [Candidatus Promineifilaceae bacterium]